MPLIYITGIPGSGKSTVRRELLLRGYEVYGGAEDNLAAFYNLDTGKQVEGWVSANDRTEEWNSQHTWKIPRETVRELKDSSSDKTIFLCAVTKNDKTELWDLFDLVIALTIDEKTLRERLLNRTNNDVGKTKHELQALVERQKGIAGEYLNLGVVFVDATQSIETVVAEVLKKAKAVL